MRILKILTLTITTLIFASGAFAQLSKGAKAPDFMLMDTHGGTFKMSSNKGKVVFVSFFATWCGPCQKDFPEIQKLHKIYADKGVKVISVSTDDSSTVSQVRPFADHFKAEHQVLFGSNGPLVGAKYKVEVLPTNFVIGKDGKIAAAWTGFLDKQMMPQIQKAYQAGDEAGVERLVEKAKKSLYQKWVNTIEAEMKKKA